MGLRPAAALLLAAALWFGWTTARPAATTVTHDYLSYYTAASLLTRGEWDARAFDNRWFGAQGHALNGPAIDDVMTYNPPTYALILAPVGRLDVRTARTVWIGFNLLLLPLVLGLLVRLFGGATAAVRPVPWLLFAALLLLSGPVVTTFLLGQSYLLLLFLLLIALWGLERRRETAAGAGLGLVMALKSGGIFLWLLPLLKGRPRVLLWGGLTIALVLIGSLPWIGVEFWRRYPAETWADATAPITTVTAYQTTRGFAAHLLRYSAQGSPVPLVDWPVVAVALPLLLGGAAVAATMWRGRTAPLRPLFAALTVLSVLLAPVAEEHTYIWMLIPLALLLAAWQQGRLRGWRVGVALLAAALVLLPLPYEHPALVAGWRALLAYPRLYGGWLLWALSFDAMRPSQAPPPRV